MTERPFYYCRQTGQIVSEADYDKVAYSVADILGQCHMEFHLPGIGQVDLISIIREGGE